MILKILKYGLAAGTGWGMGVVTAHFLGFNWGIALAVVIVLVLCLSASDKI
jgi:hypothetical protein